MIPFMDRHYEFQMMACILSVDLVLISCTLLNNTCEIILSKCMDMQDDFKYARSVWLITNQGF